MERITESLRLHYETTFERFGATSKGVDWGESEADQFLRYEKMLGVLEPGYTDETTLLDVGCGYGGLLDYLRDKRIDVRYTGIDVARNMVAWARKAHPDVPFILGDILETSISGPFDYVVCNGILTQKLDVPGLAMDQFAAGLIRRIFLLCKRGIAFNVMTTKVNFFSNNLYYRNPAELLAWCMNELSPRVKLDHSYPLYEFTMYVYRDGIPKASGSCRGEEAR